MGKPLQQTSTPSHLGVRWRCKKAGLRCSDPSPEGPQQSNRGISRVKDNVWHGPRLERTVWPVWKAPRTETLGLPLDRPILRAEKLRIGKALGSHT